MTITKLYLVLHFLLIHLIIKPTYIFLITLFYQITLLLFHTVFLYFTIYLLDLAPLILLLLYLTYFLTIILQLLLIAILLHLYIIQPHIILILTLPHITLKVSMNLPKEKPGKTIVLTMIYLLQALQKLKYLTKLISSFAIITSLLTIGLTLLLLSKALLL